MPRKPGPRPADRSDSKVFTFILPVALIEQVDAIATEERRSRVKTVEIALEDFVRDWQRQRESEDWRRRQESERASA